MIITMDTRTMIQYILVVWWAQHSLRPQGVFAKQEDTKLRPFLLRHSIGQFHVTTQPTKFQVSYDLTQVVEAKSKLTEYINKITNHLKADKTHLETDAHNDYHPYYEANGNMYTISTQCLPDICFKFCSSSVSSIERSMPTPSTPAEVKALAADIKEINKNNPTLKIKKVALNLQLTPLEDSLVYANGERLLTKITTDIRTNVKLAYPFLDIKSGLIKTPQTNGNDIAGICVIKDIHKISSYDSWLSTVKRFIEQYDELKGEWEEQEKKIINKVMPERDLNVSTALTDSCSIPVEIEKMIADIGSRSMKTLDGHSDLLSFNMLYHNLEDAMYIFIDNLRQQYNLDSYGGLNQMARTQFQNHLDHLTTENLDKEAIMDMFGIGEITAYDKNKNIIQYTFYYDLLTDKSRLTAYTIQRIPFFTEGGHIGQLRFDMRNVLLVNDNICTEVDHSTVSQCLRKDIKDTCHVFLKLSQDKCCQELISGNDNDLTTLDVCGINKAEDQVEIFQYNDELVVKTLKPIKITKTCMIGDTPTTSEIKIPFHSRVLTNCALTYNGKTWPENAHTEPKHTDEVVDLREEFARFYNKLPKAPKTEDKYTWQNYDNGYRQKDQSAFNIDFAEMGDFSALEITILTLLSVTIILIGTMTQCCCVWLNRKRRILVDPRIYFASAANQDKASAPPQQMSLLGY